MELKDFLLLLFDKKIDRYPEIRYSFLRYWNVSEIINILAITNYRCSYAQFCSYISYRCIDKGIKFVVREDGPIIMECVIEDCMSDNINSTTDYLYNRIYPYVDTILKNENKSCYNINVSSDNSEFTTSISICSQGRRVSGISSMHMSMVICTMYKKSSTFDDIINYETARRFVKVEDTFSQRQSATNMITKFCQLLCMEPHKFRDYYKQYKSDRSVAIIYQGLADF